MNYKLNDPRRNVKIFWNGNIYSKNLSFPCTRRTLLEKKKEKGKKINNTNNYTAWNLIVPGEKGVTYCYAHNPVDPINLVRPKVMAIANHPPIKTLRDDLTVGAFPNTAPNHPNAIKAKVTAPTTTPSLNLYCPMKEAARTGTDAPSAKAIAEAADACVGLGKFAFSPSSSSGTSSLSLLCLFLFICASSISS
jgi:hypothetical protein